ncbi:DUF6879 family protein [Pseudonocardia alni]|uniref:DUF6879 family protein n=1 Tax=Pseudonocardia alni TaxID=33907 RepID=UPI003332B15A
MTGGTGPTLDELFDGVGYSAFRWEGRPSYAVGGAEAERIEAWRQHQPRPERSVRTNAYLRRIAAQTLAGVQWQRVTLRSDPPTEYHRYRLAGDLESQAAGEQVLILPAEGIYTAATDADFWLLDYGTDHARAALMSYTPDGAFDGFQLVDDPTALVELDRRRAELVMAAVPLNTYVAGRERTGA